MVPDLQSFVIFFGFLILAGVFSPVTAAQVPVSLQNLTYLTEEFPPFNFQENSTPTGLAVDLLVAITKEVGDEIPAAAVRVVPLSEGLATVRNTTGSVIFSIARTPNREDSYRWVGPFASYNIVLFSLRSRNITVPSAEDLRDYTIGAVTSDVSVEKLVQLGVSPGNIVTNPDPVELITLLDEGKIDLVTSGDIAGEYFIKKMNGDPESYKIAYRMDSTPLYYAFNKETPEDLVTRFQQALDRLSLPPADGGLSGVDQVMSTWNPASGLSSLKFYTEDYYPLNYLDNNTPRGISIDVLGEMFRRLDTNLSENQLTLGSWEDGYRKTLNQTGTVIFSTARSPEREKLFLWVGPVFTEPNVIFSRTTDTPVITRPEDLAGLHIGAINDDIAAIDMASMGYRDLYLASDAKTLIRALENGTIDGWAYAEHPGKDLVARFAENPAAIRPVYTIKSHDYYYAFNRNTPIPLVQAVQRALDLVKSEKDQDGTSAYDRILKRYNLSPSFDQDVQN